MHFLSPILLTDPVHTQVEDRVPRSGGGLGRAQILRLGGGRGKEETKSSPSSLFEAQVLSRQDFVSFSYEAYEV